MAEWMAAGADVGTVTSASFETSLRMLALTCGMANARAQQLPMCIEAKDLSS